MRIYDFEGKKNISGERIREARLKLRLSQSDLAARVQVEGVTMERDSISRIEIGTRFIPDYEIPVFARVLGVSALCTFLKKLLTYCEQYAIIIDRKEVNALSKRKKKRGNKAEPDSYLNLVTAILNLVIAILLLIEKLTE